MESCLHPCHGRIHLGTLHCQKSKDISARLKEIRCWSETVAELGRPHFGEFASKLEELLGNFRRGCESSSCDCKPCRCEGCACSNEGSHVGESTVELAPDVISQLRSRLKDMIRVLRCEESCFTSWQAACRQFDDICMLIPQATVTSSGESR